MNYSLFRDELTLLFKNTKLVSPEWQRKIEAAIPFVLHTEQCNRFLFEERDDELEGLLMEEVNREDFLATTRLRLPYAVMLLCEDSGWTAFWQETSTSAKSSFLRVLWFRPTEKIPWMHFAVEVGMSFVNEIITTGMGKMIQSMDKVKAMGGSSVAAFRLVDLHATQSRGSHAWRDLTAHLKTSPGWIMEQRRQIALPMCCVLDAGRLDPSDGGKAYKTAVSVAGEAVGTLWALLYQMSYSDHYVMKVTPPREECERRPVKWVKSRTHLCLLPAKAIQKMQRESGATSAEIGEEITRAAHWRRGHLRRLTSARFRFAKGRVVWVKEAWIGPEQFENAGDRKTYGVVLEGSEQRPQSAPCPAPVPA